MPELPEVETMCRGIQGSIGGQVIDIVQPASRYRPIEMIPRLSVIRRRLTGRTILAVFRLGKRVIIQFDGDEHLLIQPKMAGLVAVEDVPSKEHLRLQLELTNCSLKRIQYWDRRGLGCIGLYTAAELAEYKVARKIGPDALEIDVDRFARAFCKLNREVKPALLDQSLVAGVGNLYASEILHQARVHPAARCQAISPDKWRLIHQCMQSILLQAIEYEGSTLSDGTYRNALNAEGSYQNAHRVYDRSGEECLSCRRGVIRRVVQSQRSTFFCPRCQRSPRSDKPG